MIPECVEPNIKHVMRYYSDGGERCSDFPFNFLLMALASFTGVDIATAVDAWLGNMPPSCWANWVVRLAFLCEYVCHDVFVFVLLVIVYFAAERS